MTSPGLRSRLSDTDLVIIPVGATEQHGPHLPLCTDSINIEAVAEDAARAETVLVAPTITYGVSENHLAFCGTIAVRPQTLTAVLVDIGESLLSHGFSRLLLLNGHGGNYEAMALAAHELRRLHAGRVALAIPPRLDLEVPIGIGGPDIELDDPIAGQGAEEPGGMVVRPPDRKLAP